MIKDKVKNQEAGDSSINYQGESITHNNNYTYNIITELSSGIPTVQEKQVIEVEEAQNGIDDEVFLDVNSIEINGINEKDIIAFYRGGKATWSVVANNIPVKRDLYEDLLQQALETTIDKTKRGMASTIICGPSGAGKETVAKCLAYDLGRRDHKVVWLDGSVNLDYSCKNIIKVMERERVHVFIPVDSIGLHSDAIGLCYRKVEKLLSANNYPRLSLYLIVSKCDDEFLTNEFSSFFNTTPKIIRFPSNISVREIEMLVSNLRKHKALGNLSGIDNDSIEKIFIKKMKKVLLVALIEATSFDDEKGRFEDILYAEYRSKNAVSRLAYLLISIGDSYAIRTPLCLIESIYTSTQESFENCVKGELKYLISNSGIEYLSARHPLISSTLCRAVLRIDGELDFILAYNHALKNIQLSKASNYQYYSDLCSKKSFDYLSLESLMQFSNDLINASDIILSNFNKTLLLNSIARTLQGRKEYSNALEVIDFSLSLSNEGDNFSEVISAYINITLGNRETAYKTCLSWMRRTPKNPIFLYHAFCILNTLRRTDEALSLFEEFYQELSADKPLLTKVEEKANLLKYYPGNNSYNENDSEDICKWVIFRLESGQISRSEALSLLLKSLELNYNNHLALSNIGYLCFIEEEFEPIIDASNKIIEMSEDSENNIYTSTKSMAFTSLATAGYLSRDGVYDVPSTYEKAIKLNRSNAWARNWFGCYVMSEHKNFDLAKKYVNDALKINPNKPPFLKNKILLEFFSLKSPYKNNIDKIVSLIERYLRTCPIDSYWNWTNSRELVLDIRQRLVLLMQHDDRELSAIEAGDDIKDKLSKWLYL